MNRFMQRMLMLGSALVALIAGLVIFAIGPAYRATDFPSNNIVTFHEYDARVLTYLPDTITAVTYNIGYASGAKNNRPVTLDKKEVTANLSAIIDELKQLNPDIVFLQEVDLNAARTFGIDQMRTIAAGLAMPYAAYAVTWNKRFVPWPYWPPAAWFGKMLSGTAILSRFPIVAQKATYFPKPSSNAFWYNWFYIDRVAQGVHLMVGDETWRTYNVHLEAFDQTARRAQLTTFAAIVAKQKDTMLAGGDFNENDAQALAAFVQATGLSDFGYEIDHLFSNARLVRTASGHGAVGPSDHPLVWATYSVAAE